MKNPAEPKKWTKHNKSRFEYRSTLHHVTCSCGEEFYIRIWNVATDPGVPLSHISATCPGCNTRKFVRHDAETTPAPKGARRTLKKYQFPSVTLYSEEDSQPISVADIMGRHDRAANRLKLFKKACRALLTAWQEYHNRAFLRPQFQELEHLLQETRHDDD